MTISREVNIRNIKNEIINPATEENLSKINQKILSADIIQYEGIDLDVITIPNGGYYAESITENDIVFFGDYSGKLIYNGACIVADNKNHSKAERIWYTRNIDTDFGDNVRIIIDNSKLVKGDNVENYTELTGQTLYAAKIELTVADSVVRELLKRWTLLNDQNYDSCQRICFSDGGCIENSPNPTFYRRFKILRSKLNFVIDDDDTLFGVVFISGDGSPAYLAKVWGVGIGGELFFDTVFTVDPEDNNYIICLCSSANTRNNLSYGPNTLPDKISFPDSNCVFFIGIPIKTNTNSYEKILKAVDLQQRAVLNETGNIEIMSYTSSALNLTYRETHYYNENNKWTGLDRIKV